MCIRMFVILFSDYFISFGESGPEALDCRMLIPPEAWSWLTCNRPVWDPNLGPPASESRPLTNWAISATILFWPIPRAEGEHGVRIRLNVCMSLYVCISVCVLVCLCVCLMVCLYVYMLAYLRVCTHECMFVCLQIWMSVCMCMRINVHAYA